MRFLLVALIAVLTSAPAAAAENYPSRPITIVLGTTKGGISDVTTRIYAQAASKELGQSIGIVASELTAKAAPDGYTLFVFSGAQNAALSAIQRVPYDATKLFAPVTPLFTMVNFLAVRSDSPAHSVSELLDWGRTKPGGLVFGSSGSPARRRSSRCIMRAPHP